MIESLILDFDNHDRTCQEDVHFDSDHTNFTLKFGSDIRPIIGGTSDYNNLNNKPQINGVTLTGNKTSDQIGISRLTNEDIESIFK